MKRMMTKNFDKNHNALFEIWGQHTNWLRKKIKYQGGYKSLERWWIFYSKMIWCLLVKCNEWKDETITPMFAITFGFPKALESYRLRFRSGGIGFYSSASRLNIFNVDSGDFFYTFGINFNYVIGTSWFTCKIVHRQ